MDLTIDDLSDRVRQSNDRPIWIAGHSTRIACPTSMEVVGAPRGIRGFVPEEMTLACGGGSPVAEVMATAAEKGQYVNLPFGSAEAGTVGGALAVGEGDVFRLGRGSIRDVLLQAHFVRSSGEIVKAGGPTVKNVSGFDVCRLMVGSCGRLGFLGEVILRTRPRPMHTRWLRTEVGEWQTVAAVFERLWKPTSLLWSGRELHMCLEGHPQDVDESVEDVGRVLRRSVEEIEMPSLLEYPYRWIRSPAEIEAVVSSSPGECCAEIGVGIVHHSRPDPQGESDPGVFAIEGRLLSAFDPHDRMNGGTKVWGVGPTRRPRASSRARAM